MIHTRLEALQEGGPIVKVAAAAGGVLGLVIPDAFFWLFLILVASNGADWIFGRHAARARKEFKRKTSRHGLLGKGGQLAILLLLRSLEYVIPLTGLPSTLGIGSAALCLALIGEDLASMERHIIDLGGSRIPGLSSVLDRFKVLTGGDRRSSTCPPKELKHTRRDSDPATPQPPLEATDAS